VETIPNPPLENPNFTLDPRQAAARFHVENHPNPVEPYSLDQAGRAGVPRLRKPCDIRRKKPSFHLGQAGRAGKEGVPREPFPNPSSQPGPGQAGRGGGPRGKTNPTVFPWTQAGRQGSPRGTSKKTRLPPDRQRKGRREFPLGTTQNPVFTWGPGRQLREFHVEKPPNPRLQGPGRGAVSAGRVPTGNHPNPVFKRGTQGQGSGVGSTRNHPTPVFHVDQAGVSGVFQPGKPSNPFLPVGPRQAPALFHWKTTPTIVFHVGPARPRRGNHPNPRLSNVDQAGGGRLRDALST